MSPSPTPTPTKKRIRKSRARGLRAKTGCLTCRKRHLKCGEQRPVCEQCQKSERVCTYAHLDLESSNHNVAVESNSQRHSRSPASAVRQRFAEVSTDDADAEDDLDTGNMSMTIDDMIGAPPTLSFIPGNTEVPTPPPTGSSPTDFRSSLPSASTASPLSPSAMFRNPTAATSSPFGDMMLVAASPRVDEEMGPPVAYSPANTDSTTVSQFPLTAELSSIRWLGLLATDAANVDQTDILAPFGSPMQTHPSAADQMLETLANIIPQPYNFGVEDTAAEGNGSGDNAADDAGSSDSEDDIVVQSRVPERRKSVEKSLTGATFSSRDTAGTGALYVARIAELGARRKDKTAAITAVMEKSLWHESEPLQLLDYEILIFRHFVESISQWMDLFDPAKHFSTMVTRLAMYNLGLMKAILTLSARHISLDPESTILPDRNIAIQYYYETLHYLQAVMQFETYTRSPELNATAVIISKYEMLDGSGSGRSGWERHLKGIFWIQRSQNINGDSGGIKSSVWWEWLRQDVWVAFRERRRVLSFWKPQRTYGSLDQHGLANRAVYLLSQAVNYCASEEVERVPIETRIKKADALMKICAEWKQNLGDSFQKLPSVKKTGDEFEPIWLHPPQFGVALQLHSFARALIILHRPSSGGIKEYMGLQRQLSEAVDLICGIAMTQTDDASSLISSQCVFGAGLCIQDESKRKVVVDMLDTFRARTRWPMYSLSEELKKEWAKG